MNGAEVTGGHLEDESLEQQKTTWTVCEVEGEGGDKITEGVECCSGTVSAASDEGEM